MELRLLVGEGVKSERSWLQSILGFFHFCKSEDAIQCCDCKPLFAELFHHECFLFSNVFISEEHVIRYLDSELDISMSVYGQKQIQKCHFAGPSHLLYALNVIFDGFGHSHWKTEQ